MGKSALAARLGALSGGTYVPEYGRIYDQFSVSDEWKHDDFRRIAEGHTALRAAVAPKAGPVLIEDTDPLLTAIWARMLTGISLSSLEEGTPLADLYLLLDIDVPWVDDGTRYFGDSQREKFMSLCREILERRRARFIILSGNWAARESQAWSAVEMLRAEPFPGRWNLGPESFPVHGIGTRTE